MATFSDTRRARLAPLVKKLSSSWAVRSAVLNVGGSALDYALLFGLARGLGWPTPIAALLGLIAGATFNFRMNRRYAFAESAPGPVGSQALRYALALGALLLVHASVLSVLVERFGAPLVAAKPACDVVLLGLGQLLVLRHFVFAPSAPRAPGLVREPVVARD